MNCLAHDLPVTHDLVKLRDGKYISCGCEACVAGPTPGGCGWQARMFEGKDMPQQHRHDANGPTLGRLDITRQVTTAAEPTDRRQRPGEIIDYVVGFLFDHARRVVVLLEKQKPLWQKGLLNGVGGKIEDGKTPYQAMHREFEEETGCVLGAHDEATDWEEFCELRAYNGAPSLRCTVHFFRAFAPDEVLWGCRTTTLEKVGVYELRRLGDKTTMANLPWLIPMAVGMERERRVIKFEVTEL